jgi:hypothetical protein
MAQIFAATADAWLRGALLAAAVGLPGAILLAHGIARSEYVTRVARTPAQPVPFSHKHHVGGLGIDCRYCHTTVETRADAGFPATHICMTCHSQIWTEAPVLAPVRRSLAEGQPLVWSRVARLPDYVYFRHDIHVRKGVGCIECHGRVDRMPLLYRAVAFEMRFCLGCHRDPAPHLRPREAVAAMDWQPPSDRAALGRRLAGEYHVGGNLTHCYTCHR